MHEKTDLPQPGVWHIPGSGQTTITIDLVHEYNKITPSDREALDRLLRRMQLFYVTAPSQFESSAYADGFGLPDTLELAAKLFDRELPESVEVVVAVS